jgi:hypothetical protein
LFLGSLTLLLGCGHVVAGPEIVRPILHVEARDFVTGQKASSVRIGESKYLMFMVYSPGDSINDPGVHWTSRDASIAGAFESGVIGRAAGTTYLVGDIADEGKVFRDSVRVTVTP